MRAAIVNISALMDEWKYSSFSQCVSNMALFSLDVNARSSVPLAPGSPRGSSHGILRFWVRHNTTDSCHQCSCCQRSATMFAVFLHCMLCSTVVRATHDLPADRAPVYRGCPCRDPLGCPPIPRQDGIGDKAPTLWLLLCCIALSWMHVRACDHH